MQDIVVWKTYMSMTGSAEASGMLILCDKIEALIAELQKKPETKAPDEVKTGWRK